VPPDLILKNCLIYSWQKPNRSAIAITAGTITALGKTRDIMRLAAPKTEVIDLTGKIILPGFIDSHTHFGAFSESLHRVNLSGTRTLAEALERVKSFLPKLAPGQWLSGRGWDKNIWGERFPSRKELDTVVPDRPCALLSRCGHILWANSRALALARITHFTLNPPGGEIEKDHSGEPTGILKEEATNLIKSIRPRADKDELKRVLCEGFKVAHSLGITTVHTFSDRAEFQALAELQSEGKLTLRIHFYFEQPEDVYIKETEREFIDSRARDRWLSISGIKCYADGSLGGQTALMFEPYEGLSDNFGIGIMSEKELVEKVREAESIGLSLAIHAIGDRANSLALDAIEAKGELSSRHRIEHAQLLRREDIPRFAKLGITASVQPCHLLGDIPVAEKYWGKRCRFAFPFKTLLTSGATVAFGTDAPIEKLNPLRGIYAAVARQTEEDETEVGWYPEERLTLEEAIRCYTWAGAYAAFQEEFKGEIAVGKAADLTAVREDFLTLSPREILSTEVELTVLSGKVVFRK
jgi:predicted amidohydrolase YtcJ